MSEAMIDKSNWLNLEINGQPVQMPPGSTVMDAAVALKMVIPHFCYHKKLSLAASCRMCLVQVEKIPKPVPACATVVSEGMKVWTRSEIAQAAQKAVMSFLMINHPLDCPVCDQGGECLLQDIAFGYGKGNSPFVEVKRSVLGKNLGPLVSAAEMSRCIQCTRCVRFADEIGGKMELGMVSRGDRSEIVPFVGATYDSEISGNVIDLCPVGALTSKPARFTARAWELTSKKSVSPHDSHGTLIKLQIKGNKVSRVVAASHEAVNECWIADRDRFSYEALNSSARLKKPLIKQENGSYSETEWDMALPMAAARLRDIVRRDGAQAVGGLISPHSTAEELGLFTRLLRELGCDNIDHRLRQRDFSDDQARVGAPWLGLPIAEVRKLKTMLFIGSFLRHDHPLLAVRVRAAAKAGAKVYSLNAQTADWRLPLAGEIVVPPSRLTTALGELVVAAFAHHQQESGVNVGLPEGLEDIKPSPMAEAIVAELRRERGHAALFLGSLAQQHEHAATLMVYAQLLSTFTGATLGVIPAAANSVGAALLKVQPQNGGLNARAMLEQPRQAYLLFNVEENDLAHGRMLEKALNQAEFVLSLAMFKPAPGGVQPDIVLPVTPFTETSGTYISMEGRAQSFNAVVPPQGQARPGWRVLTALARLLGQTAAEETPSAVRKTFVPEATQLATRLSNNRTSYVPQRMPVSDDALALERIAAVPIYQLDPLVRRAPALQQTPLAADPVVILNQATAKRLMLTAGQKVQVRSRDDANALTAPLTLVVENSVPDNTVRVDAAHPKTHLLPGFCGAVQVEVCHD